jgi:hypothetical protein
MGFILDQYQYSTHHRRSRIGSYLGTIIILAMVGYVGFALAGEGLATLGIANQTAGALPKLGLIQSTGLKLGSIQNVGLFSPIRSLLAGSGPLANGNGVCPPAGYVSEGANCGWIGGKAVPCRAPFECLKKVSGQYYLAASYESGICLSPTIWLQVQCEPGRGGGVCGADGITYNSACEIEKYNVEILHSGGCSQSDSAHGAAFRYQASH